LSSWPPVSPLIPPESSKNWKRSLSGLFPFLAEVLPEESFGFLEPLFRHSESEAKESK